MTPRTHRWIPSLAILAAFAACAKSEPAPLPRANPRTVGLSRTRLRRLDEFFRIQAERHRAAGYVWMVARDGKLVDEGASGYRNIAARTPMTLDTRFRIASMSKPITTVAVLMLYERGDFQLDDPVARFLPEFAHPRVFVRMGTDGKPVTVPASRPITIRDLLTQQGGLGYVFDGTTPLGKMYDTLHLDPHASLAEVVRKIATMPLYFEPGQGWRYSYADDVLGRLVEVVSGMPFAQFLHQEIFAPLGMNATAFHLTAAQAPLLATVYRREPDGELAPSPSPWLMDPTDRRIWPSGGGGLISTAGDYLRFAQMLANGGSLDGHEILSPITVGLMAHDQVPPDALYHYFGADSLGLGYGLGVAVELDAAHAPQADLDGDISWGGILDTHWLVSPRSGLVAVLMTQLDPSGDAGPRRTTGDFHDLLFATVRPAADPRAGGRSRADGR